jgi:hypothetical protein
LEDDSPRGKLYKHLCSGDRIMLKDKKSYIVSHKWVEEQYPDVMVIFVKFDKECYKSYTATRNSKPFKYFLGTATRTGGMGRYRWRTNTNLEIDPIGIDIREDGYLRDYCY